ncbi:hypothetical protein ACHAP3_004002 [Botrytis cinerea]
MSTIGIRQRRGESSTSAYSTARLSFGEWPEPWQENSLVSGGREETSEEDQGPAETPDPRSDVSESSSHISTGEEKTRETEGKFVRFAAEEALQQKIDLNTPLDTAGIPDSKAHKSTPTPRTWTETRENKFYVYKAPQKPPHVLDVELASSETRIVDSNLPVLSPRERRSGAENLHCV